MKEEQNKEQAILEAAEREFLEKGFAMSKTTEIAKQAGVTHAMLHYYFRTKENLFDKVFQEKARLIATSFTSIVDDDLPFLDKVIKSVETHFNFLAENPKLPFFVVSEIVANKERKETCRKMFLPVISATLERLSKSVNEEVAKGTIRPIEPFDLIMSIVSLNACVFLAHPIIDMITHENEEACKEFLEHRKQENVEMILSRLKL